MPVDSTSTFPWWRDPRPTSGTFIQKSMDTWERTRYIFRYAIQPIKSFPWTLQDMVLVRSTMESKVKKRKEKDVKPGNGVANLIVGHLVRVRSVIPMTGAVLAIRLAEDEIQGSKRSQALPVRQSTTVRALAHLAHPWSALRSLCTPISLPWSGVLLAAMTTWVLPCGTHWNLARLQSLRVFCVEFNRPRTPGDSSPPYQSATHRPP